MSLGLVSQKLRGKRLAKEREEVSHTSLSGPGKRKLKEVFANVIGVDLGSDGMGKKCIFWNRYGLKN